MSGGPGKARHRATATPPVRGSALAQAKARAQAARMGGSETTPTKAPAAVGSGTSTVPPKPGPNPMTPLMMMLIMLMVITSPGLRKGMGLAAGSILEPSIGFGGELIIMTILLAGLIMVFCTTLIRHFIMDWAKMAEVQQKMGAFQKEVRKARKSGNVARMQKLMKTHQPKVMALQAEMSSNQTKPMLFTMFIALPIFMWLSGFIDDMAWRYASLPWESAWALKSNAGTLLPHWIVLYSLMSLPFGQALQRGLKLLSFSGELRKLEHGDDMQRSTTKPGRFGIPSGSRPKAETGPEEFEVDDEGGPNAPEELPGDHEQEGDLGYSTLVEEEYGEADSKEGDTLGVDPLTGAPYEQDQ